MRLHAEERGQLCERNLGLSYDLGGCCLVEHMKTTGVTFDKSVEIEPGQFLG